MISAYENVPDLLSRTSSVFQTVPSEEWSLSQLVISMQHKPEAGRRRRCTKVIKMWKKWASYEAAKYIISFTLVHFIAVNEFSIKKPLGKWLQTWL